MCRTGPLSNLFGLPNVMEATAGRAPSLFNGHLLDGPQGAFLLLATLATAALELKTLDNVQGLTPTDYTPGELGFDPAGLRGKRVGIRAALSAHCPRRAPPLGALRWVSRDACK